MAKYKVANISMPAELFGQADRLAKAENRTRSELYREAMRQYIEAKRFQKLQRETAERARKLGITSEEDIERIINEVRRQAETEKASGL